jgi:predicted TIM-barrel fold metal-dependent hydrolase
MLIDFHTHTQATAQDGLALQGWIGGPPPQFSGAVDELYPLMEQAAIDRSLIVPWLPMHDFLNERTAAGEDRDEVLAALTAQWEALNRWAVSAVQASDGRLMCLVGFEPVLMPTETITQWAHEMVDGGACGLKVAPAFLFRRPDDPVMDPVWELARSLGVFVLCESGAGHFRGREPFGHPSHFEGVLQRYPDVPLVLAHLGIGAEEEVARLTASYPNLYTDISMRIQPSAQATWTTEETVGWLRKIGTDRVIYGSNYPLIDPVGFAATFRQLPLTDDEQADIGWRNVGRLLASH